MQVKHVVLVLIFVLASSSLFGQKRPEINRHFSISAKSASFKSEGGTKTFTVTSGGPWEISSKTKSWSKLTKNGNTLTIRVYANESTASRTDAFRIKSGDKELTINISQAGGNTLSVSNTDLTINSSGGTKTLTVESNGAWSVRTSDNSWCHVTTYGKQLSVNVDPNKSTVSRSDFITVKAGPKEVRVIITQSGDTETSLSLSDSELLFASSTGIKTITVSSNKEWTVGAPTNSWVHLTRDGNSLSLKVDDNNSTSTRTAYFTVKAEPKEVRVNITQSGETETSLSVSETNLSFGPAGGDKTITITTNKTWRIALSTASWGHLIQNGNQLTLKVDPNPSSSSRDDYFKIRAGDKEIRVDITQSSKNASYSSNYSTFTSSSSVYPGNNDNYRKHKRFNHAQDRYIGGLSIGYIQKQWIRDVNGENMKIGFFDDDKYIQGLQAGLRIDPQFGGGFGINSGFFYEYCWAQKKGYDSNGFYNRHYEEYGLYIPVHVKYNMNFSKWFQLSFYGGFGLNYVLNGKVSYKDDSKAIFYSRTMNKNTFNAMIEYGASLRIKAIQFDVTMSEGIRNMSEDSRYRQEQGRPLSLSMTICF